MFCFKCFLGWMGALGQEANLTALNLILRLNNSVWSNLKEMVTPSHMVSLKDLTKHYKDTKCWEVYLNQVSTQEVLNILKGLALAWNVAKEIALKVAKGTRL